MPQLKVTGCQMKPKSAATSQLWLVTAIDLVCSIKMSGPGPGRKSEGPSRQVCRGLIGVHHCANYSGDKTGSSVAFYWNIHTEVEPKGHAWAHKMKTKWWKMTTQNDDKETQWPQRNIKWHKETKMNTKRYKLTTEKWKMTTMKNKITQKDKKWTQRETNWMQRNEKWPQQNTKWPQKVKNDYKETQKCQKETQNDQKEIKTIPQIDKLTTIRNKLAQKDEKWR